MIRRRQVGTFGDSPTKFLDEVSQLAGPDGYLAILEVCGFHDWLLELLPKHGCREVMLVQGENRDRRKTDRRDASKLSELLWVNRHRLLARLPVQGLKRVVPPTPEDRDDRRLTQLHFNVVAGLTRTINGVRCILRRLNIEQHCPTKGIQTQRAKAWLKTIELSPMDRFEMDQLLERWKLLWQQRQQIDVWLAKRAARRPAVDLLKTTPGVSDYTALALACRIGDIRRFATPRSLPNYWGLTPSCRNSGESTRRLGAITKEGSALARGLLGHLVLHVLRKDAVMRLWFARIKKRRGAKIARVAVMRRLAVIFWHMLSKGEPYELARAVLPEAQPSPKRRRSAAAASATAPELGALPPDPRDLAHCAAFEGQERSATGKSKEPKKRADGASHPPFKRRRGSGAQVTSQ